MRFIKSIMPDLLILSGAAGISYGVYLINEPYGYCAAGAFMLITGILMSRIKV